jgi:hypothetical protein
LIFLSIKVGPVIPRSLAQNRTRMSQKRTDV